jgi:hypothetical protein
MAHSICCAQNEFWMIFVPDGKIAFQQLLMNSTGFGLIIEWRRKIHGR